METLDLHGIKHENVNNLVEDFILRVDIPCRIITGNSPTMKRIVTEVLEKYNLTSVPETDYNLGSLIVSEK
ncbi:MAG: hypothetical protein ACW99G_02750 [Candidatus Thorarchaeota archaeon]|jgi:hypothetical protein